LIERERMRLLADDFVKSRNANIEPKPAVEYHNRLCALAAGEEL
jgi:hypothetical protein